MRLPTRRHFPFYCALAAGVAGALLAFWLPITKATVIAANAFFAVYLVLTFAGLTRLTADHLRTQASADDEPVWIIFLVTLGAAVAAIAALFVLINQDGEPHALNLALALSAVPLGWFTIHMMAAMHYAHVYWQPDGPAEKHRHRRGLQFPGTENPAGIDFVYFAFVTGMTAQTSDVAVTTQRMRATNIVHGIVSFFFNTVLVAAAVNLVVSLS
jgi:uncharacterized membrane protein